MRVSASSSTAALPVASGKAWSAPLAAGWLGCGSLGVTGSAVILGGISPQAPGYGPGEAESAPPEAPLIGAAVGGVHQGFVTGLAGRRCCFARRRAATLSKASRLHAVSAARRTITRSAVARHCSSTAELAHAARCARTNAVLSTLFSLLMSEMS
eukprot:2421372-Heterocapsa_arctica.AAC.1